MGDVVAINFGIGGMNCASCVGRAETALGRVEGVQAVSYTHLTLQTIYSV